MYPTEKKTDSKDLGDKIWVSMNIAFSGVLTNVDAGRSSIHFLFT